MGNFIYIREIDKFSITFAKNALFLIYHVVLPASFWFWFSELNLGKSGEKHFPTFLKELSYKTALPYTALFSSTGYSIWGSMGVPRSFRICG